MPPNIVATNFSPASWQVPRIGHDVPVIGLVVSGNKGSDEPTYGVSFAADPQFESVQPFVLRSAVSRVTVACRPPEQPGWGRLACIDQPLAAGPSGLGADLYPSCYARTQGPLMVAARATVHGRTAGILMAVQAGFENEWVAQCMHDEVPKAFAAAVEEFQDNNSGLFASTQKAPLSWKASLVLVAACLTGAGLGYVSRNSWSS